MCIFVLNQLKAIDGKEGSYFDLLFFIITHVDREQILLPMNFEYMLLILFTLTFLGVRYLVITLYSYYDVKQV